MIEINKIYNDDCINILKQLPDKSIDLILTDPPYLLDNHGGVGMGKFAERKLIKLKHINWISEDFDYNAVFNEFIRVCKPLNLYIFCSNKQISRTMSFFENKGYKVTLLMWHKVNAVPLVNKKYHDNVEFIVCVRDKNSCFNNLSVVEKSKIISMPYPNNNNRLHPTEKPLKLIELLIRTKSNEDDLVLDCFSGSGTTAVACHNLKRNFICVEKDYNYWELSVNRLERVQAQMRLF
jgi:DNA modification methylase